MNASGAAAMVREDSSDIALEASHFAFLQQNKNALANNVLWKRKVRCFFIVLAFWHAKILAGKLLRKLKLWRNVQYWRAKFGNE
ncbi:unnamed protein product [Gongylonema pulchrum]|uniref:Myosin motor domain-containing protein n=1 Tax=Gongylonema pulchrum TaxID=637853 RepID=A0A183F1I5_9BILA|nr:unnamed protein product [Gongylonema pulchrum]